MIRNIKLNINLGIEELRRLGLIRIADLTKRQLDLYIQTNASKEQFKRLHKDIKDTIRYAKVN
ncbi:TPA: hypothetical protein ACUJUF_001511 [Streptococcus agalactiae]|nr:hypothetical protein [Streptococcus agalactiae]